MNVRTIFLGGASVVLALGLSAAQAQTPEGGMAPGGPPAAEKSAPGGGPSGGMMEPQGKPSGGPTATESSPGKDTGKAAGKADQMGEGEGGKAVKDDKGGAEKPSTTGAKDTTEKAGTAEKGETKTEGKTGASSNEGKTGATADTKTDKSAKGGETAKVDASKVKTHFSQHKPNVKSVSKTEVSVSVGVALPSAIVLYDLPPDIIVVEGGCPVKYFLWGDDTIVLVDSCTREVVELIAIA